MTPANAMVGTAVDSSSASRGYVAEVADQRRGVAAHVCGDGVHVAALALGRAGRASGVARRAWMSTGAHSSWPSSARAAWPSAKVGSCAIARATDSTAPARSRSRSPSPALYAVAASAPVVRASRRDRDIACK